MISGTDSEDAAPAESYQAGHIYEPGGTEADSSSERSTSGDDCEDRLSDLSC